MNNIMETAINPYFGTNKDCAASCGGAHATSALSAAKRRWMVSKNFHNIT